MLLTKVQNLFLRAASTPTGITCGKYSQYLKMAPRKIKTDIRVVQIGKQCN